MLNVNMNLTDFPAQSYFLNRDNFNIEGKIQPVGVLSLKLNDSKEVWSDVSDKFDNIKGSQSELVELYLKSWSEITLIKRTEDGTLKFKLSNSKTNQYYSFDVVLIGNVFSTIITLTPNKADFDDGWSIEGQLSLKITGAYLDVNAMQPPTSHLVNQTIVKPQKKGRISSYLIGSASLVDRKQSVEQGNRLKLARKLTLLSRRAFAKKYDFNSSSYQAWEDGKYKKGISLANAEKIVQAMAHENICCDLDWLILGNGQAAIRQGLREKKVSYDSPHKLRKQTKKNKRIRNLNIQLIDAIKHNKVEAARLLIVEGANLHQLSHIELYLYDVKEYSALHYAAWYGGVSLVQMFIDLGLKPSIRSRYNETPMHLASFGGNDAVIKKLLDLGASIECTNNEGTRPVMWAAQTGQGETIRYLVSLGANINDTDYKGRTAAHWAAFHGNVEALSVLYDLGAYLDIENHEGKTPLDVAMINGQLEAVDIILSKSNIK